MFWPAGRKQALVRPKDQGLYSGRMETRSVRAGTRQDEVSELYILGIFLRIWSRSLSYTNFMTFLSESAHFKLSVRLRNSDRLQKGKGIKNERGWMVHSGKTRSRNVANHTYVFMQRRPDHTGELYVGWGGTVRSQGNSMSRKDQAQVEGIRAPITLITISRKHRVPESKPS